MKTYSFPRSVMPATAIALGIFALGVAGCSKQDRAEANATAKEAYADTKSAMSNAWDEVKAFSFDRKNDFTASAKALSARAEAQMSELRADYSEAKASASRKAAMSELKDSESNYKERVDALGNATAATWDSAKQNVIAAWDRLQASIQKARAD
jgi:hypothetical protein